MTSSSRSCRTTRELASARLDDALTPAEEEALEAHLAECSACAAHAERLAGLRALLAQHTWEEAPAGVLEALDARLLALDEGASDEGGEAWVARLGRQLGNEVGRRWARRALTAAAGLAFVAVAASALFDQRETFGALLGWGEVEPEVRVRPPSPPVDPVAPTPGPVRPGPTQPLEPEPSPEPRPRDTGPTGPPTPEGPAPDPTRPRPEPEPELPTPDPEPEPWEAWPEPGVALDLGALENLLMAAAAGSQADPAQRPHMIAALADVERFHHPSTYAFLASVLSREFDAVPEVTACRRAAVETLGRLGTAEAVGVLTARGVGELEAARWAALRGVVRPVAVARLSEAVLAADRSRAEREVFGWVWALAESGSAEGLPALRAVWERGRAGWLRREAGLGLGRTGVDVARGLLVARLTDPDPWVRQGACLGLAAWGARRPEAWAQVAAALAPRLRDADPEVGVAAARGLGVCLAGLGPWAAWVVREEGLAGASPRVRAAAAEARALIRGGWGAPGPRYEAAVRFGGAALEEESAAVAYVVDRSGSMRGERWALVAATLPETWLWWVRRPPSRRPVFDLRVFAETERSLTGGWVEANSTWIERARRSLTEVAPEATDPTALGRVVQRALEDARLASLVLVSDGLVGSEEGVRLRYEALCANRARLRPVRIHTVHVRQGGWGVQVDAGPEDLEHPADVVLMRGLARDSGGTYARN